MQNMGQKPCDLMHDYKTHSSVITYTFHWNIDRYSITLYWNAKNKIVKP